VLFPLYTSTVRDDRPGQVLAVAPEQLLQLPPLTTVLRGGKRGGGGPKQVPVTLAARTTAIGTLELYCVAKDGGNRWRLEFNTREVVAGGGQPAAGGDVGHDRAHGQVRGGGDDGGAAAAQVEPGDLEVVGARVALELDDAGDGDVAPVGADEADVLDLEPSHGQPPRQVGDGGIQLDEVAQPGQRDFHANCSRKRGSLV
jgi:hypothetical protein